MSLYARFYIVTMVESKTIEGCRICKISSKCGKQLIGPSINSIRPDNLHECFTSSDVKLPDEMAKLFCIPPTVSELPYYNTRVESRSQHQVSAYPGIDSIPTRQHLSQRLGHNRQTDCRQSHYTEVITEKTIHLLRLFIYYKTA